MELANVRFANAAHDWLTTIAVVVTLIDLALSSAREVVAVALIVLP